MKNKQEKIVDKYPEQMIIDSKQANNKIKSLFCYGNEDIKKIIWSLKTDQSFFESENGKRLIVRLWDEVQNKECVDTNLVAVDGTGGDLTSTNLVKTIIICVPSSSFWQSKKSFDHMHVFMKACVKNWKSRLKLAKAEMVPKYIPYSIIPRLNKDLQKGLNKKDREKQSLGAYELSNYFKLFLKYNFFNKNKRYKVKNLRILIIDDVKTTGSTLIECSNTVENYIKGLLNKHGLESLWQINVVVNCLTIAYEA